MKDIFTQLFDAFKSDFKSAALAVLIIAVGFLFYRDVQKTTVILDLKQQLYESEKESRKAAEREARELTEILLRPVIGDVRKATQRIDTAVNIVKDKYE